MTALIPFILGLTAWGLAGAAIFCRKKSLLCCLSWCACACTLWFPLYTIERWTIIGDASAIYDCAHGYTVCAGILLLVTALLNLAALLIRKKA